MDLLLDTLTLLMEVKNIPPCSVTRHPSTNFCATKISKRRAIYLTRLSLASRNLARARCWNSSSYIPMCRHRARRCISLIKTTNQMPLTLEGQMTMEKTPSYFVTKRVPSRVKKMNPYVKLIVVVRDPVTRAISDYTQSSSKKPEYLRKSFADLFYINGTNVVNTRWGIVRIGLYARYLDTWLKYFPLSQFIFISGETLIVDPAAEMKRLQDFLGLKVIITEKHFYFNTTKGFPCLMKSETLASPHCLGKNKGRIHPKIDESILDRLTQFYRPFNLKFYQMTGIDFGW
ncbi:heparan sulfate glucosamine 3-O-sulfotransferase 6 isoform X4 [Diaphorina citri]|uniref:Heparan sulfate glucosamine 3-O-sulfotransferase 6 isoform X4 n=1 Tax=Diaphorina citri TaxID=121845 RepID=A0A3Q0IPT0_DIACI|nr:heparan sulfate glucosamine 3-O-sulfotransferase 6 isoform X4 [Diaphorina citri]